MQSKKSLFSKTIFFKNISRNWLLWVAYIVVNFIYFPLFLSQEFALPASSFKDINHMPLIESEASIRLAQLQEVVHGALDPMIPFLFALITAVALFWYLYQSKSSHMLHALPIGRNTLFFTNVVSGLCILIIPQIITFFISVGVCCIHKVSGIGYLLHWLILSCGMTIFAFALAIFVIMITSHIIAVPIFFLIANCIFDLGNLVIQWLSCTLILGIDGYPLEDYYLFAGESATAGILTPYSFLSKYFNNLRTLLYDDFIPAKLISAEIYGYIGLFVIIAIILFLVSAFLYRKRHLEKNGDIVAFPVLKPIMRWIAALILGPLLTVISLNYSSYDYSKPGNFPLLLLIMALVSILAFIVFSIVLDQKLKIFTKKRVLEGCVAVVLLLVSITFIEFDVFGIESKVPDTDDIAHIRLFGTGYTTTSEDDFAEIIALHENIINNKEMLEDFEPIDTFEFSNNIYLNFDYYLKNGDTLSRTYYLPTEEQYVQDESSVSYHLKTFLEQPKRYLYYHFGTNPETIKLNDSYINFPTPNRETVSTRIPQKDMERIYQAFLRDINDGSYWLDYEFHGETLEDKYENTLFFYYTQENDDVTFNYGGFIPKDNGEYWTAIHLTTDCVHTISVLEELGIVTEETPLITEAEYKKLEGSN